MVVICDIDGTLANVEHRAAFARLKEWETFHSLAVHDECYPAIRGLIVRLETQARIVFITGRPERYRLTTKEWLFQKLRWVEGTDYALLMRPEHDRRSDAEVKPALAAERGLDPGNVLCVLEDRTRVVEAWRRAGFTCLQVREGDY